MYAGMGELLTQAHADRFRAEQHLIEESLARRADMGHMHDEMLKLRHRMEREMRSGLEEFREQYQNEALAQISQ